MAVITNEITLDVAELNRIQAVVGKQYDKQSRFLKVTITNHGDKIMIAAGSTVVINARRSNNTADSFSGSVNDDGTVTVPITYYMLELDGPVQCDISIINSGDVMLTTTLFEINVEKAARSNTSVDTDPNKSVLLELIDDVEEVTAEYEASVSALTDTVDAKMDDVDATMAQVATDVQNAIDATQLVTGPFYIVDTDNSKTYQAAIQIRGGKPFLLYDEYTGS